MSVVITRGDDIRIATTLKENGVAIDVSAATTITAAIVSTDGATQYAEAVQASGEVGADWANGIVVVVIPAASTTLLPGATVTLEVQVLQATEKNTWYADTILSRIGSIT